MDCFLAQVHGRVQGVSFRYYTQKEAKRLGLTGWVRNEFDGTVKVLAEGPKTQLLELANFLQVGPRSAIVDKVDLHWDSVDHRHKDFTIRW